MMHLMTLGKAACAAAVLAVLVMGAVEAGAAATSPAGAEADRRAQLAAGAAPRGPSAATLAARESFLTVERFARLPAEEQAKGLGAFYRDVAPRTMSNLGIIGALSSYPTDILNRGLFSPPGDDAVDRWAGQLQAAAKVLTPEEVADRLTDAMWLQVAGHSRTRQVLLALAKPLAPLVEADLDSLDVTTFQRGAKMVQQLRLTQYTGKLLDVYLPDGPRAKAAFSAILWMRDPAILERLRADAMRDPKTLARHAGLFQGPLQGKKVDPEIAKLLSSPDADVRYYAAYALEECKDEALAKPIAALAKEPATRMQEVALKMALKLSADAFTSIRGDLVPLLRSTDAAVQDAAIKTFAGHKDLAVAPVLREFLAKPPAKPGAGYNVTITQALNSLTGSMFGYDYMHWGQEKNAAAISKFDEWVLQHGGAVELGNRP